MNLIAMDTALNRATGATISSRQDWANYQVYVASKFASKIAGTNRLVSRQRAVTKALLRAGWHFGVGEADQRAAQRYVRRHGWPSAINKDMLALGMNSVTLSLAKNAFLHVSAGSTTSCFPPIQFGERDQRREELRAGVAAVRPSDARRPAPELGRW